MKSPGNAFLFSFFPGGRKKDTPWFLNEVRGAGRTRQVKLMAEPAGLRFKDASIGS